MNADANMTSSKLVTEIMKNAEFRTCLKSIIREALSESMEVFSKRIEEAETDIHELKCAKTELNKINVGLRRQVGTLLTELELKSLTMEDMHQYSKRNCLYSSRSNGLHLKRRNGLYSRRRNYLLPIPEINEEAAAKAVKILVTEKQDVVETDIDSDKFHRIVKPEPDDLNQAVVRLKLADESTESDELEMSIDRILAALHRQDGALCKRLLDSGLLNTATWSLKANYKPSCKTKLARMVAEMAKNEFVRKPCIDAKLIPVLCNLLTHDDADVVIQTCRALGNICCDYDEARLAISQCGGLKTLVKLLNNRLMSAESGSPNERLRTVACGFLMNLTYGNGPLQTEAVSLDVVNLIIKLLKTCSEDVVLCGKLIMCAGNLADQDCNKVAFVDCGICELLTTGLGSVTDSEQLEMLLELVASLAENDSMKIEFAREDLVDVLLSVVEKFAGSSRGAARGRVSLTEDEFDVEKIATDIIVLLLTGDESMRYLFQNGQGKLFMLVLTDWLSSPSPLYKISAALALGNFARSDEHCIKLVELGIVGPLLKLLRTDDNNEDNPVDMRLGHAVLSALRNLAISKVNKPLLLQQDMLPTILPLIHMDMHPVQFKLLGTIRMLVDGQAETAVELGENTSFIQRVVELCECQIHAGVAGEANRLLAALVKHSASPNVMQTIVSCGGIKPLVSMATCEHTLMQNEALVALTLIASTCLGQSVPTMLECGLLKVIKTVLQDNGIPDEVQCNVLTLSGFLTQSETLKAAMTEQKVTEVVQSMCSHSNEAVRRKASSVCQHFT